MFIWVTIVLGSHLSFSGMPYGGNWATILVVWWASLRLVGVFSGCVMVAGSGAFLVGLVCPGLAGLVCVLWAMTGLGWGWELGT